MPRRVRVTFFKKVFIGHLAEAFTASVIKRIININHGDAVVWAQNLKRGGDGCRKCCVRDQDFGFTMAKDIGNRVRVEPDIDGVQDSTCGRNAIMTFYHFRCVECHDRNRIALGDAERGQSRGEAAATGKTFSPSIAAVTMNHSNAVWKDSCCLFNESQRR